MWCFMLGWYTCIKKICICHSHKFSRLRPCFLLNWSVRGAMFFFFLSDVPFILHTRYKRAHFAIQSKPSSLLESLCMFFLGLPHQISLCHFLSLSLCLLKFSKSRSFSGSPESLVNYLVPIGSASPLELCVHSLDCFV